MDMSQVFAGGQIVGHSEDSGSTSIFKIDNLQAQSGKNITNGPTNPVPPFEAVQHFSMQSEDTILNPLVNNMLDVEASARDVTVLFGDLENHKPDEVNLDLSLGLPYSDVGALTRDATVLFYDQENSKPPEVNLELSLSLPESRDAVNINEKFMLENKWEAYQQQLFGMPLMPSTRPVPNEPVCLCFSLGGFLNDNGCDKCGCGTNDGVSSLFWPLRLG